MSLKAFFLVSSIFSLIGIVRVQAQIEASNWFFGNQMGLKFTQGPQNISGGQINSLEGTAAISDNNGNLLFYTDGVTVWNSNHQPMPNGNGLLGFNSSSQSAIILRKPGSSAIYYIFTADGTSSALNHHMENGYRYSIVDMTLQGGLGDVTVDKNILLYAPSTERIAAVKQADGVNYWLMTHEWNSNRFLAYSLTCEGLNTTPVISAVGESSAPYNAGAGFTYLDAIGQMKFSPDGSKLVQVIQGKFRAQLLDFDPATGQLSNPVNILAYWMDQYLQPNGYAFDFEDLYGAEFSPDGTKLYLTKINSQTLFQYDITQNDSYAVSASGNVENTTPWCTEVVGGWTCPGSLGALQLGPDGKIYAAYKDFNGLNVIAQPNAYGSGMDYERSATFSGTGTYGLPSFPASYFNPFAINYTIDSCVNVSFSTNYSQAAAYEWDFGDLASSENTSSLQEPVHQYASPGTYTVQLILTTTEGCSDTLKKNIYVSICENEEEQPLLFPNIITPNNDGNNDVFVVTNLELVPDNQFTVLNRWGNVIFQKNNYSNSDPFSCTDCSEGVYFYQFTSHKSGKVYSGFLTVLH